MTEEDSYAKYIHEWRRSDERRYLLKKGERRLKDEQQVRENLMKQYEQLLIQHEQIKVSNQGAMN